VKVGQGHLRGGDKPQVILFIVVEVIGKFRQVARTYHTFPLHHKWGIYLLVAVLGGMEVEHKGDEGSLKSGAYPLEHVKAGAR